MQVHGKPPNRASQRYGPDRNTTLKREHREHIRALDIHTHQVVLQEVGAVIELHPKRKLNKPVSGVPGISYDAIR